MSPNWQSLCIVHYCHVSVYRCVEGNTVVLTYMVGAQWCRVVQNTELNLYHRVL